MADPEEPTEYMLCGACAAGRPDDCSGWCGIPRPLNYYGPWPEWHLKMLEEEFGVEVDFGW